MKTYKDGIQDAIWLMKALRENSIDYIIDRLQDYDDKKRCAHAHNY
jgi:hypothetical protein